MHQTAERTPTQHGRRRLLDLVRDWQPSPATATLAIVATAIAYAFATFFARRLTSLGISPTAVAFFRFAITAAVLARFVNLAPPKRAATRWGFCTGFAMAIGWIAYVQAIETGDVAVASIAYMTYPMWTLVALAVVFGVRPSARAVVGGALVLVAAGVGLGPTLADGISPLVFAAPATFGFAVAVLTERLCALDPFERLAAVALGASVGLCPLLFTLSPGEVLPTAPSGWLWIIGIGVGCALVPMTIYAAAAPALGAARSAVAGAAELPTVFIIGAVFFAESIRVNHLLSAVMIVAAIALTPSARATHVLPDQPTGREAEPTPNGLGVGPSAL